MRQSVTDWNFQIRILRENRYGDNEPVPLSKRLLKGPSFVVCLFENALHPANADYFWDGRKGPRIENSVELHRHIGQGDLGGVFKQRDLFRLKDYFLM